MDKFDTLSKTLSNALNFLFLHNPKYTSFGIVFGVFLYGIRGFFVLNIPSIDKIEWYAFIALGVMLFNIPNISKKYNMNPSIETHIAYLQKIQKEGNFSEKEKRQQWRDLITTLTNNVHQNDSDNSVST